MSQNMMWDNLPDEICTDILSRLPVKSLIRCTILSKYFQSFITNPDFITAHLDRNNNNDHLLLRYVSRKPDDMEELEEKLIIECDDDSFCGFHNEGLVGPCSNMVRNVLGCINGVICLVNDLESEGTNFVLWNPCIRKIVELPEPQHVFSSYGPHTSASGFGFDPVMNDYKVVRIVHLDPGWPMPVVAEVYSLRSGCWKSLGHGPEHTIRRCPNSYKSCFVEGCVHWVGHSFREGCTYTDNVIVKFDVSSERFGVVDVPSCLKHLDALCNGYMPNLMVQECRGMLALISRERDGQQKGGSIWVLKEYGVVDSWTKVFDLDVYRWNNDFSPSAFGFGNNGNIIVAMGNYYMGYSDRSPGTHLMVSIHQEHGATVLGTRSGLGQSFFLSTYQESIVLLQEGRRQANRF